MMEETTEVAANDDIERLFQLNPVLSPFGNWINSEYKRLEAMIWLHFARFTRKEITQHTMWKGLTEDNMDKIGDCPDLYLSIQPSNQYTLFHHISNVGVIEYVCTTFPEVARQLLNTGLSHLKGYTPVQFAIYKALKLNPSQPVSQVPLVQTLNFYTKWLNGQMNVKTARVI